MLPLGSVYYFSISKLYLASENLEKIFKNFHLMMEMELLILFVFESIINGNVTLLLKHLRKKKSEFVIVVIYKNVEMHVIISTR